MYGEEGLVFYENGVFGEEGELLNLFSFLGNPSNFFLNYHII